NQPLRPLAVLLIGPTGLGLLMTVAVVVALPELRSPRYILFAFGAGLVVGLTIFAPIAGALAFRAPLRRWLAGCGFAVQWYAVELMSVDFSPPPLGTCKSAGSGMNSALQVRRNWLNSTAVGNGRGAMPFYATSG